MEGACSGMSDRAAVEKIEESEAEKTSPSSLRGEELEV